ncbi:uncharacterized protein LOC111702700 [Eurytemora carolleeae]|uniref:uncharacterized protein LOC111702700 n=1 Tax=Eurytemora carolleeae TaxID=1294199 RepID=UPI000C75C099|nr:uncharacterized protein LOC111702700 [Eurytemora carolleeae]|eukprot:XP_023330235.1 uncharacterized protein LOC111702700 [Eurytemora affinis]
MFETTWPFLKALVMVLFIYPTGVPAPVPRCSPFIIINKLAESSNIISDTNPYFPVGPCEYGNPMNAIRAGDLRSVFVFAEPEKVLRHNFYELVFLFKTAIPRILRMAMGQMKFIQDPNILAEGYQHYTPFVRTTQLGQGTQRRPEIIDDERIYNKVVGAKLGELFRNGPDRIPGPYTPQGNLRKSSNRRKTQNGEVSSSQNRA